MKTIGIIAEYNPFHNGHLYHTADYVRNLTKTKIKSKPLEIVC